MIVPHFCCQAGAAPEIVGYYAANLIREAPTVRSANLNAFLLAFMFDLVTPVSSR
jgi:hypothetical protein